MRVCIEMLKLSEFSLLTVVSFTLAHRFNENVILKRCKGIVQQEIKLLFSFTRPQFVSSLCEFLSAKIQKQYLYIVHGKFFLNILIGHLSHAFKH